MISFFQYCLFSVILLILSCSGYAKLCEDIVIIRDSSHDVIPAVVYFEDSKIQKAEIFCDNQNSEVVELVSNSASLGVIEKDQHHSAICRLGRWYSLDKHHELTVVKHVGCVVHE